MTINERIKHLRRKCDLTQEKLAEYLGVSPQAVSKWECGLACPDLSLIGPLTKLLKVSSDELLGLTPQLVDERKAYFDAEYKEYWLKEDKEADLNLARQAVQEYPDDFRYREWLAGAEYYAAYDEEYLNGGPIEHFHRKLEPALEQYLLIVEDCPDQKLRNQALYEIVRIKIIMNRQDEARKFAEMIPEKEDDEEFYSRDAALRQCLQGDDLIAHKQKMIRKSLHNFCHILLYTWEFVDLTDPLLRPALDTAEGVIRAVIPDGNYLGYSWDLFHISVRRAELAMLDGDEETATAALMTAKAYAEQYDRCFAEGVSRYTAPLLSTQLEDCSDTRAAGLKSYIEYLREILQTKKEFAPLLRREDIQAL